MMRVAIAAGQYPLESMGGSEYQALLLAQGLATRGHEVTFLGLNTDESRAFEADGLPVVKVPGWRRVGQPEHQRLVAEAIAAAAPDLCYLRAFTEIGVVGPACRARGIPLVSMSCHAMETSPILTGQSVRDAATYLRTGETIRHLRAFVEIRHSAAHICNTRMLQDQIRRWYPSHGIGMIYNGSPVPPFDEMARREKQVIWVNNLKRWKRPEVLVRLAHRLPAWKFVMIGRMAEGKYGRWIASLIAQGPPNLSYLGPKSVDEVNEEIARSALLLYTSRPVEGFGNSFLQAWLRGAPTVSLSFDLDGIPEREGIGRCARTFEELVDVVNELMRNDDLRNTMGRHARAYAVRHHAVDRMVNEYEALFTSIVDGRPVEVASGMGQRVTSG